jgi:serine O-acetyltransferase
MPVPAEFAIDGTLPPERLRPDRRYRPKTSGQWVSYLRLSSRSSGERGATVAQTTSRPYFERALELNRARQPRFFHAVFADARVAALVRGDRHEFNGRLDALIQVVRLMVVTDAFFGQVCYRAQARLYGLGVPFLPHVFHRLAMMTAQVCIGRSVLLHPGVLIAHGQTTIDGFVEIHRGTVIYSWTSIGLRSGKFPGPTIHEQVRVGTGAKVLGPIKIDRRARIGANAVVVDDVPAGAIVVGAPARPINGGVED